MGNAVTVTYMETLEDFGGCSECGVHHAAPSNFVRARRETGGTFYCPNGHSQVYKKSEVQRLREQLEAETRERQHAQTALAQEQRRVIAYKGRLKSAQRRIANGVCPCCKRTFKNLARHMSGKHPHYAGQDVV